MRKTEAFARRLIKQFTKRFSIVMKSGALKGMRIVAVAGPKFQHDRYEPEFFRAFIENLKEGMVVYDVGAHWGYYTLVASRVVGDTGRVIPSNQTTKIYKFLGEIYNIIISRILSAWKLQWGTYAERCPLTQEQTQVSEKFPLQERYRWSAELWIP